MLRCADCGRRLHGDTGYYRHREPCEAFLAAQPPRPKHRGRVDGKGYRREWYEAVVGDLLALVSLRADTLTAVVGQVTEAPDPEPDRLALARIERERESALGRYRRDRDARALEATMARLDADEADAAKPRESTGMPAGRAVAWLEALGEAWVELADQGEERRRLASALFDSLDVEGFQTLRPVLTTAAVAHGFAHVLPEHFTIPARGFVGNGRGERGSPFLTQQSPRFSMVNATPPDSTVSADARSA